MPPQNQTPTKSSITIPTPKHLCSCKPVISFGFTKNHVFSSILNPMTNFEKISHLWCQYFIASEITFSFFLRFPTFWVLLFTLNFIFCLRCFIFLLIYGKMNEKSLGENIFLPFRFFYIFRPYEVDRRRKSVNTLWILKFWSIF